MTNTQRLWGVAIVTFSLFMFYLLEPILAPFLVAMLLAYLGDPLADRLELKGLGRSVSVTIVFVGLTLLFLLATVLTVPIIGKQLDLLAVKVPVWLQQVQQVIIPWAQKSLGMPEQSLHVDGLKSAMNGNWGTASDLLVKIWDKLAGSGIAVLAGLANLALIPVVTFYLLRDWDILMAHIADLLPRSVEPTVTRIAKECDEILGAFIRGQLLVMLALGIIYSIGLWLVGIDLALILGLVAGLASIVPYMGFIVGITVAGIAAWFQFNELTPLLAVGGVFAIGQILEGMVLTPMLVGDRIGLHPVAVIFAIMAGGQMFGFSGILLALPIAAIIMVFLRHIHRSYKNSNLYHAEENQ